MDLLAHGKPQAKVVVQVKQTMIIAVKFAKFPGMLLDVIVRQRESVFVTHKKSSINVVTQGAVMTMYWCGLALDKVFISSVLIAL